MPKTAQKAFNLSKAVQKTAAIAINCPTIHLGNDYFIDSAECLNKPYFFATCIIHSA